MSVTYTEDRITPFADETTREPEFVPVYARTRKSARRKSGGKIKTWMILAPVGAVVLAGGAVAMMMGGGEEAAAPALSEPAATAPVVPIAPAAAPATVAQPVVEAASAPAPVVRAAPVERIAPEPVRRAQPRAAAPVAERDVASTPRVITEPAAPSPTAALNTTTSPTPSLNTASPAPVVTTAPTPAPAETRAPAIVVQPLN